jgi:hypothetical protein
MTDAINIIKDTMWEPSCSFALRSLLQTSFQPCICTQESWWVGTYTNSFDFDNL